MKHTLSLGLAMFLACLGSLQAQKSCCTMPVQDGSTEALALNASFQAAHEVPAPLHFVSEAGKMITYKASDGQSANAYIVPSAKPSDKILIMCHEWWGLNDYIKREAEEWSKELGVTVYAVDLYDGKVGTTQEEAGALMSKLDPARATSIVSGLLNYIGTGKEIATIGWCMGGSWSFQTALLAGKDAKACVMYYGFPEEDAGKIKRLQTDVLYIYASQDDFIKRPSVDAFAEKIVKESGRKITVVPFDAVHAFANPSNPKYNSEASATAKKMALDAIRKGLKL
jgi:carboxymethylenebutenolidase